MTCKWMAVLLATLIFTLVTQPLEAKTEGKINAAEVEKRSKKLLETVTWHRDLDKAVATAKSENKPLIWIQMVGDLDGGL